MGGRGFPLEGPSGGGDKRRMPRPRALVLLVLGAAVALAAGCSARRTAAPAFTVAPFTADVTPPVGHGMMGGYWKAVSVADPLEARGVVLQGAGAPVVLVSVDWCEIRNEAYDRWRTVLAAAAGTTPERVLVSSVHQHEAPVADLGAQRAVAARGLPDGVCDPAFHEAAVLRVAAALRASLARPRRVTHLGRGQARVQGVAANRRYLLPDGRPAFNRGSAAAGNVLAREAPEGTIDPWLRTLSLWDGDEPVVAWSAYAVHPMSYYRTGEISADFPGLARARRQQATPGCLQIYFSGAAGNVTAGKFNDGSRAFRAVLAGRLEAALSEAWRTTRREPLARLTFRSAPVLLPARADPAFLEPALAARLSPAHPPAVRNHAALGLAWRERVARAQPIDVPAVDFGPAVFLLLPAEAYVEFQLAAQRLRPDAFVVVAGYGESSPGYIPPEQARAEGDTNLGGWSWVGPGAEPALLGAMRRALGVE